MRRRGILGATTDEAYNTGFGWLYWALNNGFCEGFLNTEFWILPN